MSTAQYTPFSGGSVVSQSPACFSSVWSMTHHIPEKRRISCYHFHRVRIHSWQNAAVLSRMRMSRRSRRAAALMADLQSQLCGERGRGDQQHEPQELFQDCRCEIATRAGQYASATTQTSGNAVIDPVSVAAWCACISPYSRAYSGKCLARRVWVWRATSTSPSLYGKMGEGDRGCDLSHPASLLLLFSGNNHDVVPPQAVVPVRI